jgi:protein gp37
VSDKSAIEWTDATWNPVTGCTEVSPGCDHCYAKTFAERWRGTEGHYFERGFDVQLRPDKLDQPLRWRRSRRIFVNSMSDLFHDAVSDEYIARVWGVMAWSPRHTYQVLTKRHARMRSLLSNARFKSQLDDAWYAIGREKQLGGMRSGPGHPLDRWPLSNVWLGVSAENQQWADIRIPALLDTPAAVRFVSAEPLLGPIDLREYFTYECPICYRKAPWTDGRVAGYDGCDINEYWCQTCGKESELDACASQLPWVIVGGESGRGARPMHLDWVRRIQDQCAYAGTAFLFKQHGEWIGQVSSSEIPRDPDAWVNRETGVVGDEAAALTEGGHWQGVWRVGKHKAGRLLDGRTWDQYPEAVV